MHILKIRTGTGRARSIWTFTSCSHTPIQQYLLFRCATANRYSSAAAISYLPITLQHVYEANLPLYIPEANNSPLNSPEAEILIFTIELHNVLGLILRLHPLNNTSSQSQAQNEVWIPPSIPEKDDRPALSYYTTTCLRGQFAFLFLWGKQLSTSYAEIRNLAFFYWAT